MPWHSEQARREISTMDMTLASDSYYSLHKRQDTSTSSIRVVQQYVLQRASMFSTPNDNSSIAYTNGSMPKLETAKLETAKLRVVVMDRV